MKKTQIEEYTGGAWERLDPGFRAALEPYHRLAMGTDKKRPDPNVSRLQNAEALAAVMHRLSPEAKARAWAAIANLRRAAS